jgi:DNA modification methylase
METNIILNGDCIEELKKLPDNSVDAIITDPPYGLEFMGKDWDKFKEGKNIAGGTTGIGTPFGRSKAMPSFYQMNKKRFGIKGEEGENDLKVKKNFNILPRFFQSDLLGFQEFTTNWASECLRVLKPGGYLLSFGGTRTYHRMACGIEDAGFEIRDCIMWVYGSGFPKSLNIGKQIDKIQGVEHPKNIPISDNNSMSGANYTRNKMDIQSDLAKEWEGWGTALKPACEPIVVARKPLSEKNVALNVLKWGTGGINIDECRIEHNEPYKETNRKDTSGYKEFAKNCGSSSGLSPTNIASPNINGRFPANIILDEEAGRMLDEQSGISNGGTRGNYIHNTKNDLVGFAIAKNRISFNIGDKGGASRFFYCAKASKSERNNGCEELPYIEKHGHYAQDEWSRNNMGNTPDNKREPTKNNHPTVKPISLMEYLIKLVSKENAIVLDPFLGSGTTAIACLKLNRRFIGIEKEPEYIKIAQARIKPYLEQRKLLLEEKQDE